MLRPFSCALVVLFLSACEGRPAVPPGDDDDGVGEGEGEGEGGAIDLVLDVTTTAPTLKVGFRDFAADACEVAEGCVAAAGVRALLGFDLTARNVGGADLVMAGDDPHLSAGTCGGQVLSDFIHWRVVDLAGAVAADGALDVEAVSITAGSTKNIILGPCALLDVTDLPAGDYDLELTIDPDGLFDADTSNNTIVVDLVTVDMQCGGVACGGVCCPADKCAPSPTGDACQLADLSVDSEVLFDSAQIIETFFGGESCSVIESCVSGTGDRRLLNFSTTTPNTGNIDMVMGRPEATPELYSFSDCHDHFHFDDYAAYRLLTLDGEIAATGHKQAFCLMDLEPRAADAPQARFDCSDQGISKGWADTYGRHLDCQWVDITGVPEGDYILEVSVNFARIIPEMDYTNNIARVPVFVPADPNACIPAAGEICDNGLDETCDDVPDDGCAPLTTNDTCAEGLFVNGSGVFTGTIEAGNVSDVVPSCGGEGGELFFNFDSGPGNIVYLSTYGSDIDTTLSIYRGNQCGVGDEEACVDDGCGDTVGGSHFVGQLASGPYVAVVKAKQPGAVGNVRLQIQNAGCNGALPIDAAEVFGDTTGALNDTAPTCGDGSGPDELWYFTTCPGQHDVALETCGFIVGTEPGQVDRFDSILEVREGACLGPPAPGACNDDTPVQNQPTHRVCSSMSAELTGPGAGDGLWFLLVDGFEATDEGRYGIRMTAQ